MPPKKSKVAPEPVEAAPPPPPPDPAVVAAQEVVARWEARRNELTEKVATSTAQIKELCGQKTKRENEMKELSGQVQTLAVPKPPEPVNPKDAKTPAKKPGKNEAPPPPPAVDEEEQKKVQKNTLTLLNAFKKKREKPIVETVEVDGEQKTVVKEVQLPKPTDFDPELWTKMLELRDQKFTAEDTINTMRSNIETLTARRDTLAEMKALAQYSLEAAQFEVKKLTELKTASAGQSPVPPDHTPQLTASALSPTIAANPSLPPKSPAQQVRGK